MKRTFAVLAAAALTAFSTFTLAQAAAVVEGVQMPAWLERGGERRPLAVGMELKAGDSVKTGAGSRALVKLSEGSLVKLGENGSLLITEVDAGKSADSGGIFKAALRVAEGAFRFTTDLLQKTRKREVSIRVATVTAGIRGTDLWGKSVPDRQVVCLIEGAIEVGADGEKPALMDQPRQFYRREKGQTQPIGFVEPAQLGEWAKETDIETGKGAARRGGRWKVVLASPDTQSAALELYDAARDNGYAAEIRPAMVAEKQVYHVRIPNLPSKAEGEMLAASLLGRFGIVDPRVTN